MKFKLVNIEIRKTKTKPGVAPSEYVTAQAVNATNIRGSRGTYVDFDKVVIDAYKEYMVASTQPDVLVPDPTKTMPEDLAYLANAFLRSEELPYPCYRKYTSNFVDGSGRSHNAGDWIMNSDGATKKIFYRVPVLAQKEIDDETAEVDWVIGKSPKELMEAQLGRIFFPATDELPTQQPTMQVISPAPQQVAQTVGIENPQQAPGAPVAPQGTAPAPGQPAGAPVGQMPQGAINPNQPPF